VLVIEGGDLACGELLMLIGRRVRKASAGTVVSIATTDPAAPIDIPAWCHLTGHRYRGTEHDDPSGPFLVELAAASTPVDPNRPWHRLPEPEASR